ncbi:MAG: DUF3137 domain-containing protein [Candidatus Altiarchaeota archaeon]|nr:DUF3137 domain-containing protein [Candidatus Altiarchaeota archaeon]
MKTVEEFKAYYREQMLPVLQGLETDRKRKLFWIRVMTFALVPVYFACSLKLYDIMHNVVGSMVFSLFFCLGFWLVGYGTAYNAYITGYNAAVTKRILSFINPSLAYYHNVRILLEQVLKSNIFLDAPYYMGGSDYIAGTVGKTRIAFSHVNIVFRSGRKYAAGRLPARNSTAFRGIFFVADFNKNFRGRTVVLPDTAQRLFGEGLGGALQSRNTSRGQLVKLEDPEFERLFVVYGDDQIEARYILSPGLMERITNFRRKVGRVVYLSFVENKLRMAIPYANKISKPQLSTTALDFSKIEDQFRQMELFIDIVEDLNLNTHIWGKA